MQLAGRVLGGFVRRFQATDDGRIECADPERGKGDHRASEAARLPVSGSHPVGRFKARFFAALGFSHERWIELEMALREQHLSQEPAETRSDEYGRFYTIRAILIGPRGGSASVVSIWCIRTGEDLPRLVTAYPGRTT